MESQESLPEDETVAPMSIKRQCESEPALVDIVSVEDVKESKVMRCERCNAVFASLVQFMDHRNFECGSGGGRSSSVFSPTSLSFPQLCFIPFPPCSSFSSSSSSSSYSSSLSSSYSISYSL